jgi:hypothetical protein
LVLAASPQGRVALEPRAGQLVRRLWSAAAVTAIWRCSTGLERLSLHPDVAVSTYRRNQLAKGCR